MIDLAEEFSRQHGRLLEHARALLRNAQQAEDVVQEAYLRAQQKAQDTEIGNPAAYLFRITHNLALDLLRQQRRRPSTPIAGNSSDEPAAETPTAEDRLIARERLAVLAAALANLPPRMAETLILARLRGWPHHRIAQELGVSERTVFNDLKIALLHCRAALSDREDQQT